MRESRRRNRQTGGDIRSFEELFDINHAEVVWLAEQILAKGSYLEAPIYIPEVAKSIAQFEILTSEGSERYYDIAKEGAGPQLKTTVTYKGSEMRPCMRFMAARDIFKHLVKSEHPLAAKFRQNPEEVLEIQANIFAGALLVPANLLRKEVEEINSSLDIVMQLALSSKLKHVFKTSLLPLESRHFLSS